MTLVRWNPIRDLASMEIERLERMFGGVFDREGFGPAPQEDGVRLAMRAGAGWYPKRAPRHRRSPAR